MKLYTEEQVRQAMQIAMIPSIYQMDLWGQLKPIELPSTEEIHDKGRYSTSINGFLEGGLWVIEQIKQQGK